ncbi:RluA family pseudouridine synthase [Anaeromyxobacter diazotrophicus]|uniref:Pseudouridine synthase n=1 Tax=Anaeromyxobacter diazotrophicus TaxID=2590199 RepID=A0A7I9VQF7_9BACT|nr:RluA family pseudouridine synthase [Anaeromyxobacter diazotrophicus]GEJ58360.1 pseudouridine synthase [Anaeromyxobacter diazotrophicus]
MPETRSLLAPAALAGLRLDVALTRLAPDLTRARAQRLLEGGHVLVDGRAPKAAARLRGGERLVLTLPDPEPSGLVAQDLPLQVLFEDDDLLVLDKAAGMVVHPARGSPHSTVVNALLYRLGSGGPGDRLGLVHRLDKETSGCLVVAKREEALAALQAAFKRREVEKRYLALVHGAIAAEGRLDTPYGRHPRDRTRYTSRLAESSRRAITAWRVREAFPGAALVEVELHTGRTHQIRVHLSEAGHPLLADAAYGGTRREARLAAEDPVRRAAAAVGRQALHAWRLAFPHPRTGEQVAFEAPLPRDFEAALAVLRAPASPR